MKLPPRQAKSLTAGAVFCEDVGSSIGIADQISVAFISA